MYSVCAFRIFLMYFLLWLEAASLRPRRAGFHRRAVAWTASGKRVCAASSCVFGACAEAF